MRRKKYDLRVAAYGTLDETNAAIGIARLHTVGEHRLHIALSRIQNDLFDVGADLCDAGQGQGPGRRAADRYRGAGDLARKQIDLLNAELTPLKSFVLPGGFRGGGVSASRPHRLPARRAADRRARWTSRTKALRRKCCNTSTGCRIICSLPPASPTIRAIATMLWQPGQNR